MALQLYVKIGSEYKEVSALAYGDKIIPLVKIPLYSAIGVYIVERTSAKSKATRKNEKTYFSNLYVFLFSLGIFYCADIKAEHMLKFKKELLTRVSGSTANRQFNTFKNFFNILIKRQIIYLNPCISVERERVERPKIHLWTVDEFEKTKLKLNFNTQAILDFIWLCGARNIEAIDLVWTDVDQEAGLITLRSLKSAGHFRRIPISEKMSQLLHRIKFKGIYVFGGGSKFTSDSLGKLVKRAVLAAGCNPMLTVYGIRHTFCRDLLAAGLSRPMIQELMGHKDWRTTENYVHWEPNSLKKALGSIR